MSRVFLSHSGFDSRQAAAVKQWLIEQESGLVDEIYLDVDPAYRYPAWGEVEGGAE